MVRQSCSSLTKMKVIQKLSQEYWNIYFASRAYVATIPKKVANDVPFVCQFSSPANAELSLTGQLTPKDDPEWAHSGARTQQRYADWAYTMCGMACLAMILEYFYDTNLKPATLAEDALASGVYVEPEGEAISSMRYKEFADWVKQYGVHASVISRLRIRGILYALASGHLVIVSVNPNIRGYATANKTQVGGHLVVVTGFDTTEETITINNPSGFVSLNTQKDHTLAIADFMSYFAGRGIIVSPG